MEMKKSSEDVGGSYNHGAGQVGQLVNSEEPCLLLTNTLTSPSLPLRVKTKIADKMVAQSRF